MPAITPLAARHEDMRSSSRWLRVFLFKIFLTLFPFFLKLSLAVW
jgi:hypothetical protein